MTQFNQKHPDNLAKVCEKNFAEGGVTLPVLRHFWWKTIPLPIFSIGLIKP
jgi:hypothetical protein